MHVYCVRPWPSFKRLPWATRAKQTGSSGPAFRAGCFLGDRPEPGRLCFGAIRGDAVREAQTLAAPRVLREGRCRVQASAPPDGSAGARVGLGAGLREPAGTPRGPRGRSEEQQHEGLWEGRRASRCCRLQPGRPGTASADRDVWPGATGGRSEGHGKGRLMTRWGAGPNHPVLCCASEYWVSPKPNANPHRRPIAWGGRTTVETGRGPRRQLLQDNRDPSPTGSC